MTPEELEDRLLAPYATPNGAHGGRIHGDEPSPFRTPFQRDRDRVIHSKAFRRLGYKTQVFANSEGDSYRTRLTHSIEVGQISRSVAAALGLNRDLAETLALAHDLGHTPFGHAGQDALHECMRDFGGFEHNQQSLRIVTRLETRYTEHRGLNLSRAVLAGMMKHERVYDCDLELHPILELRRGKRPPPEGILVDLCDRIAYIHHDLEDGIDARILSLEELAELPAWAEIYRRTAEERGPGFLQSRAQVRFRAVLRTMMDRSLTELIEAVQSEFASVSPDSPTALEVLPPEKHPVRLPARLRETLASFQKLLFERVYRHPRVMRMSRRGERIVQGLFREYRAHPRMMPRHYQESIEREGLERVVADYVSGMTDRYALRQFAYLRGHPEPR